VTSRRSPPVIENPWQRLRRFTDARIALGRAGVSLPTRPHLEFQFAHARARDAVHLTLDIPVLETELAARQIETVRLRSAAGDRRTYLTRPDLGRQLDDDSRERLSAFSADGGVVFVVADGLSALAVHRHAIPLLEIVLPRATETGLEGGLVVLVDHGRVAIGDEIGERLGAAMSVVLIGERPGLSSPDSLGVYLTYDPRVGRTDAERNCISNIRREGLAYAEAAQKLVYLMTEAYRRRLSGVQLKDETPAIQPEDTVTGSTKNFLVDDDG